MNLHQQQSHNHGTNVVALNASQESEYFRLAMKHSAIGMALVAPDGKWLKVNDATCELFGYTESELLQTNFLSLTHPEDIDLDLSLLGKMLAGEIETYRIKKRYVSKNTDIVHCLLTVSMVKNTDNSPKCFISQIQDMTDSVNAESKIRKSYDELQKLTLHIAHEFKNPLSGLHSLFSLIRKHVTKGDNDKAFHMLNMGMSMSERLANLSNDLLEYSHTSLDESKKQVINLDNIFTSAKDKLQYNDGFHSVNISFHNNTKQAINGLHFAYKLMFDNILSNALKYRNTKISNGFLHIYAETDKDSLQLSFMDNGLGLSPENASKMFNMFTRFHPDVIDSSGVGMYVTSKAIERLGGGINAQCNEHGGITINATIPL